MDLSYTRSWNTQLASKCNESMDHFYLVRYTYLPIDVIYFDFWKAFETVCTCGPLAAYKISGNALNWIKSFLVQRK